MREPVCHLFTVLRARFNTRRSHYYPPFIVVVVVVLKDHGQSRRGVALGRGKGSDTESLYDTADDEMLDSVLKSAAASTTGARPRTRKRAPNNRKSCELKLQFNNCYNFITIFYF